MAPFADAPVTVLIFYLRRDQDRVMAVSCKARDLLPALNTRKLRIAFASIAETASRLPI
jgi:hypothetical protein